MPNELTVRCQYINGATPCRNKTKDPTGLCPQHRKSMPLRDINEGTGKPRLMTAIPRVGPAITTSYEFTVNEPDSNVETANMLVDQVVEESVDTALARSKFIEDSGLNHRAENYAKGMLEDIIGFAMLNAPFKFNNYASNDRREVKLAKERLRHAVNNIPWGPNRKRMIEAAEARVINKMSPHLKEKYTEKGLR
jgi:hypothetical protein